jgi:hypothetical protein
MIDSVTGDVKPLPVIRFALLEIFGSIHVQIVDLWIPLQVKLSGEPDLAEAGP